MDDEPLGKKETTCRTCGDYTTTGYCSRQCAAGLPKEVVREPEEVPPTQDPPHPLLPPPPWRTYVTKVGSDWTAILQVGTQYFRFYESENRDPVVFHKEMMEKAMDTIYRKAFEDGFRDGFENGTGESYAGRLKEE